MVPHTEPVATRPGRPRAEGRIVGGRYRLGPVLGAGGVGVVHEAEHVRLGAPMAVKLLRPEQAPLDPVAERRFEREARVAAAFKHPSVVAVIDYGHDDVLGPYVVMEKLEGESLARHLDRRGRLGVEEAIEIARQVLAGLAAGHAHHLVHRDVKPGNVFLERHPDGGASVKLLDFGASKSFADPGHEITHSGIVLGTPPYMAPEVLIENEAASPSADVYAVGVLLYEMLTGRLPYDVHTAAELVHAIVSGGPRLPRSIVPDLPPALEALVMRTLSPDVTQRPSSARELREKLEEIAGTFLSGERRVAPLSTAFTSTEVDAPTVVRGAPPVGAAAATRPLLAAPDTEVDAAAVFHAGPTVRRSARRKRATSDEPAHGIAPKLDVRRAGLVLVAIALATLFAVIAGLAWRRLATPPELVVTPLDVAPAAPAQP